MLMVNSLAGFGVRRSSDPDAAIKALFAAGEQGAWYDPSDLTTMFQDRAGTTPVTADGQTVGLILDKSKGFVLGSELVTGYPSATGNGTISVSGDTITATCTANGTYGIRWLSSNISNVFVKTTFEVVTNSVPRSLILYPNLNHAGINIGTSTGQKSYLTWAPTATGGSLTPVFSISSGLVGESFSIKLTSIKEIQGNHATAPSDAARPLYKTDGTYHWLQFDWVDDNFIISSFNALTPVTLFFGGSASSGAAYEFSSTDRSVNRLYSNVDWLGFTNVIGSTGYSSLLPYKNTVNFTNKSIYTVYGGANCAIRLNGVDKATTTSTGWPSNPFTKLSLGCVTDGSIKSDLKLYSFVVRCADSSADEITATETWVNSKTGAF